MSPAPARVPERDLLDAASGQPLHPAARDTLLSAFGVGWADPARDHLEGRRSRILLDAARASIAQALGARPAEVSFTASGTQALHLAVLGGLAGRSRTGSRLVVSAVEHSAVLRAADRHEASGGEVVTVGVDRLGRVDPSDFLAAATTGTAWACLQLANAEVGTRQPVEQVLDELRRRDVPLLVDATASVGRIAVPPGWSALAASAHLWGGPPGLGVLAVRGGVRWRPPLPADEREHGRVPGFPAVPLAAAAATALEAVLRDRDQESARLAALVDHLRAEVVRSVPDVEVLGDPLRRLPHLVTFSCLLADGAALVQGLDRHGFAVASGSACSSDTRRPSHVLAAMGALTHGNLRVSLPHGCPPDRVERFLAVLPQVVADVRARLEPVAGSAQRR